MSGKQVKRQRQLERDAKKQLRVTRRREKSTTYVHLRGKRHRMLVEGNQIGMPIVMAMLALEDPRVDAILKAYGVKVFDVNNVQVWPEPKEAEAKDGQ